MIIIIIITLLLPFNNYTASCLVRVYSAKLRSSVTFQSLYIAMEADNHSKAATVAQKESSTELVTATLRPNSFTWQASTCTEDANALDQPWESSLTDDDLHFLEDFGLGVAVNITSKRPWARKSAFQAKPVCTCSLTSEKRADLIVINESNRFQNSEEQVDTYFEVQTGMESSFRPDPSKPIHVSVSADFHRSSSQSKTIKGTSVLTRTVAFRAKDPMSKRECKEEFENNLHRWLMSKGCVACTSITPDHNGAQQTHLQCDCCNYSPTTNHFCIEYLHELGGVTHYISSVTLGAMRYQILMNSTTFMSASNSAVIGADSLVTAAARTKAKKKLFQSSSNVEQIGKIPQHCDVSKNLKEPLRFRTKGEAVVRCNYNSLANLVSHPQLHQYLDQAIQGSIDLQNSGTCKFL